MATANKWRRYTYLRGMMPDVIGAFERAGLVDYARRMQNCGRFVHTIECGRCATRHFAGFTRCRVRFCLPCNRVRSLAWVKRVLEMTERVNLEWHLMTLTLRDRESLDVMLGDLRGAWRRIHDSRVYRDRFRSRFKAGLRSLEVVIGRNSGMWHAHYHCLVGTPRGTFVKDYDWFQPVWKDVTGGHGSVDIRAVRGDRLGLLKGIVEVTKYITKFDHRLLADPDLLRELVLGLRGVRQVQTWGAFYGMIRVVEEDLEREAEDKLISFICQKCGCTEGYLRSILYTEVAEEIFFDL